MLRYSPFVLVIAFSFLALSCADTVAQTSSIEVKWDPAEIEVFQAAEKFGVLTSDLVDPPALGPEEMAFNDMVNEMIKDAMQAEPVCLTLVEPTDLTDPDQPDLWAANGLGRTTEGGWIHECVGGWWWGYWGWYWDSCAYWRPTYVEWDVGSLLIPAGPPPAAGEEPEMIFAGLAQAVVGTVTDPAAVRAAVQAIFQQWPVKRTCSSP